MLGRHHYVIQFDDELPAPGESPRRVARAGAIVLNQLARLGGRAIAIGLDRARGPPGVRARWVRERAPVVIIALAHQWLAAPEHRAPNASPRLTSYGGIYP